MALDLAGGKIYWTNQTSPNGTIQRADLDGNNMQTLIPSGLSNPTAIALDIPGGRMYWAEFAGNKIRRANLDGSNIQDVASAGLADPAGVALDLPNGKVCWCDASAGKIERANLDGTSREDVVTGLTGIYRIAFIPQSADCDGDGTLNECEINVPVQNIYAAAPGIPIPDGNPTGITSTINVPIGGVIADLDVLVNIPHTWQGDLVVTLTHAGVTQTLINRAGLCANPTFGYYAANFGPPGGYLELDDSAPVLIDCYAGAASPGIDNYAGPAQPSQPLAVFNGLNPTGSWTLTVSDDVGGYVGGLAAWQLVLLTTSADTNGNGIPDECEGPVLCAGDADCDGDVDFFDIDPFVARLGLPCP